MKKEKPVPYVQWQADLERSYTASPVSALTSWIDKGQISIRHM